MCSKHTFLLCGMAKKTIKDYFKTVDVFTEDLPVQVINAPVIVHTIEPPRRANTEQRQGYAAQNMSHSQAVFLDCHHARILAASASPFTLKDCSCSCTQREPFAKLKSRKLSGKGHLRNIHPAKICTYTVLAMLLFSSWTWCLLHINTRE